MPLQLHNTNMDDPEALNHDSGADFVKTKQTLPPSLIGVLRNGQRGCSLDGDADRLMYYFIDERGYFVMLDGDKIATLVAAFIVDLVHLAGLKIRVGVVQTAYANGASTKYLAEVGGLFYCGESSNGEQRLPVKCVPTGVKHLHHAAQQFDVGVYFEANGHGTVLFSDTTLETLESHEPSTPAQSTALKHLNNLVELINQTVGDALSDLLLVEVVLAHKGYSAIEWNSLYSDMPNRLVKVRVPDRGLFKTEDAERRLVSPAGLQPKIDDLCRRFDGGRAFVRPSGTEDVVRVYAEAVLRSHTDGEHFLRNALFHDADFVCRACFPRCWSGLRRGWRRSEQETSGFPLNRSNHAVETKTNVILLDYPCAIPSYTSFVLCLSPRTGAV